MALPNATPLPQLAKKRKISVTIHGQYISKKTISGYLLGILGFCLPLAILMFFALEYKISPKIGRNQARRQTTRLS